MARKDARKVVQKESRNDYKNSFASSAKYTRIPQHDDGFIDAQFKPMATRIPWKAIGFALVLFVFGTFLLLIGSLLVTGYIDEKYGDRTWPLIILGALMFIPGAYHSYVAYYAFQGSEGYSFEDIPAYDDDYKN